MMTWFGIYQGTFFSSVPEKKMEKKIVETIFMATISKESFLY